MNSGQLAQLEKEAHLGRAASSSYDTFIGPFIQEKRELLYTTFQEVSIVDTDALQEIKRQLMVLNTLDQEIKTIIETGKLAARGLANQSMDKH